MWSDRGPHVRTAVGRGADTLNAYEETVAAGPVRVLVVDDHLTFRTAMVSALRMTDGVEVVGEAGNGAGACEQALLMNPDVILMDLSMPDFSGIEATTRIQEERPDQRVVILTAHADPGVERDALAAGVTTLLPKGTPLDDVVDALVAAAAAPVDLTRFERGRAGGESGSTAADGTGAGAGTEAGVLPRTGGVPTGGAEQRT